MSNIRNFWLVVLVILNVTNKSLLPLAGAQQLSVGRTNESPLLPHEGKSNEENSGLINHLLPNIPWFQSRPKNLSAAEEQQINLEDKIALDSFWKGFTSSTAMIIATEIGDKTFFIAAVLCMRNSRIAVFGGAILALIAMTIISTVMGFLLPQVLPKKYTHILGGLLFLYFGYKLLRDSRALQEYKVSDELEEVEEELLHTSGKKDEERIGDNNNSEQQYRNGNGDEESGKIVDSAPKPHRSNLTMTSKHQVYKVFIQSFVLTFFAEWGDRSQIATIALAASHNPYGVTIGACFGHSLCTGLAVIGGRMLATRISEKSVTFWGGWIFLGFGLHSLFLQD